MPLSDFSRPLPVGLPAEAGGREGRAGTTDQLRLLPLLQPDQVTREQHQLACPPYLGTERYKSAYSSRQNRLMMT